MTNGLLPLPPEVVLREAFDDTINAPLLPGEDELVAAAVPQRRREFATTRRCARSALCALGHPPTAILAGARREPLWPPGAVGSLTHCAGYRAAAAARRDTVCALGIDAEPAGPLPDGVLEVVSRPEERAQVRRLSRAHSDVPWGLLLFSAKESTYKALYPVTGRALGFGDATVAFGDATGSLSVTVLVSLGPDHDCLSRLAGRWSTARGLVLTSVVVRAPAGANPRLPD